MTEITINPMYEIGQTVYVNCQRDISKTFECEICKQGLLDEVESDNYWTCPKCHDSGEYEKKVGTYWAYRGTAIVDRITLQRTVTVESPSGTGYILKYYFDGKGFYGNETKHIYLTEAEARQNSDDGKEES